MLFLLADTTASVDPATAVGLGAAIGAASIVFIARVFPFFGKWLAAHNHPLAAEGIDVAAEYAQALESGKSPAAALESTMKSPEAQDLVSKAVAHFGAK